jgi:hypothetical protein
MPETLTRSDDPIVAAMGRWIVKHPVEEKLLDELTVPAK